MTQTLSPLSNPTPAAIGELANSYVAKGVFSDYHDRIAENTERRQRDDLALFARFLADVQIIIDPGALYRNPQAWSAITYGLVETFIRWQLQQGYAIGSINVRLATVKRYCELAVKAGTLPMSAYALIKLVQGYSHKEGRNIDKRREQARRGHKKAEPMSISFDQAQALKNRSDTPQGRRDALLWCLLLDHGFRCGEIAALPVHCIDLNTGTITFYRQKVDKVQVHELTKDTLIAAMRYFQVATPESYLLMGSRKGGKLQGRMSERAITDRVKVLCEAIGIKGASAHDARHAWATFAVRGGTDIKSLQDAGGWNSIEMPARYIASQKIANKGVVLGR